MTKTTSQIYQMQTRMYRNLAERTRRLAARADPATGGNSLLIHNWGNAAARAVKAKADARWSHLSALLDRMYDEAEHRRHGPDFRPLWCRMCCANE